MKHDTSRPGRARPAHAKKRLDHVAVVLQPNRHHHAAFPCHSAAFSFWTTPRRLRCPTARTVRSSLVGAASPAPLVSSAAAGCCAACPRAMEANARARARSQCCIVPLLRACRIAGPVDGPAIFENCTNCQVAVAATVFKANNCSNCEFGERSSGCLARARPHAATYHACLPAMPAPPSARPALCCEHGLSLLNSAPFCPTGLYSCTQPAISGCSGIRIACWSGAYPLLTQARPGSWQGLVCDCACRCLPAAHSMPMFCCM